MKAAVVRAFEQGPQYGSFELPAAGADGIVVDVLAAALSPRVRSGASGEHYTSAGVLPLVPGIDGVGRLADGRRVYFLAAGEALGTMAERTIADGRLTVALPDGVGATAIAAGMLPAISSWVALTKRAPIAAGQRVLVLGATGASGLLAVQIAKRLGAGEVIAVGRSAVALERARSLGADQVIPWTADKASVAAVAAAASEVDIVLDYLWGNVTSAVMPAICRRREDEARALRWVLIGSMAGDELALSSVLLRKRNLVILGSGQGASTTAEIFSVVPDIVAAFAAGQLHVELREVPLADVASWWAPRPGHERIVFVP
jgi:NADPH:quinone reductase-like Zn-dependent oxidoreductase